MAAYYKILILVNIAFCFGVAWPRLTGLLAAAAVADGILILIIAIIIFTTPQNGYCCCYNDNDDDDAGADREVVDIDVFLIGDVSEWVGSS